MATRKTDNLSSTTVCGFDKLWSMNNAKSFATPSVTILDRKYWFPLRLFTGLIPTHKESQNYLGLCNPRYHCVFPTLRCISRLNACPLYVTLSNIYCSTFGISPANLSFRYTWLLSWFHSFNDNIRTSINAILAYFWISERITIQISLYKRASKCAYR